MALTMRWQARALAAAILLTAALGTLEAVDPVQEGLTGRYFFSVQSHDVPVHTHVDPAPSTGRLADAWNPPVPQQFSATWEGSLLVLRHGRYTFATVSDDGSHVYVDGTLIVDNGGAHAPARRTGSVELARGVHAIAVDYDQRGGGTTWSCSGAETRAGSRRCHLGSWRRERHGLRQPSRASSCGSPWPRRAG